MDNRHSVIVSVNISDVLWVCRRNEGKFNGLHIFLLLGGYEIGNVLHLTCNFVLILHLIMSSHYSEDKYV
jgi:hypothetical protein